MCAWVSQLAGDLTRQKGVSGWEIVGVFLETDQVPPSLPAATALLVPLEKGTQDRLPQSTCSLMTDRGRQRASGALSWKGNWNLSFPEFKAQGTRNLGAQYFSELDTLKKKQGNER